MQHVNGLWDSRLAGSPTETPFVSRGAQQPPKQPNIVFLLADDLGWGDLSCYGSLHIKTPQLDRLAASGVRFTHAYSSSPWCSPMRISLYTGRNPGRLPAGLAEPLITRDENSGIPHDHPTLPSLLKDGGYNTAMFGKWHCGWLPWFSPLKIGFDEFFGNLDGAMDYFTHLDTRGQKDLYEGEAPIEMQGYYTSLIAKRAVSYVHKQSADVPFYMQVNWNAPHWPWEGPGDEAIAAELAEKFADPSVINPLRHGEAGSLAKYAELVEAMDSGIGEILDALEAKGLSDNTIVVFCSDNGGERYSFMWPFVGEKGDITEGGIRVPFLLSWPAAIDGGQWTDETAITMDWTATLLAAAGCKPTETHPLDGVNLLPWLAGSETHPKHTLFWRIASQGALRKGAYKYILDNRPYPGLGNWPLLPGVRHRLFDVSGDGREHADLAQQMPELLAEMKAEWKARAATLLPYPDSHYGLMENVVDRLAKRRYESWSD